MIVPYTPKKKALLLTVHIHNFPMINSVTDELREQTCRRNNGMIFSTNNSSLIGLFGRLDIHSIQMCKKYLLPLSVRVQAVLFIIAG